MFEFIKDNPEAQRNEAYDALIASLTAILATRYKQLYRDIAAFFTEERIQDWLNDGLSGRFSSQLPDDLLESYFPDLFESMRVGMFNAGRIEADFTEKLREWKTPISFDATSQEAQSEFNEMRDSTRQYISSDIRAGIDSVSALAYGTGLGAAAISARIKDSIGITPWQLRAIDNYRDELRNQDRAAVRRALRDEKYDRTIEAYIDGKLQLPESKINSMVAAYARNMVAHRAAAQGQITALAITNGAISSFWVRAARLGLVSGDSLTKYWITRGDEKVRHSHRQIPFLNAGGVRGMDAPFQSPLGAIRYPGDPRASLENRAGCRCILRVAPK